MLFGLQLHSFYKVVLYVFLAFLIVDETNALEVKGIGNITYTSWKPGKKIRHEAIQEAKNAALESYVSTFSSAKFKLYKNSEQKILGNLDKYFFDTIIIDETTNKDLRLFSVVIRTNVNETLFDNTLGVNSAAGAQATGEGSLFSFIFLAREPQYVKSFDARKTVKRVDQNEESSSRETSVEGNGASVTETTGNSSKVTTGGSTLRKANEVKYKVHSASDIDAGMSDVLSSAGFEVVSYPDIVGYCGGPETAIVEEEFVVKDTLSAKVRKSTIDAARECEVSIFAVGSMDVGIPDTDPVSGNQRVYVSVRGQVWNIASRLPRKVASVGPIQYAGLGPDGAVATRNALIKASKEAAKTIVDQLNAKGIH